MEAVESFEMGVCFGSLAIGRAGAVAERACHAHGSPPDPTPHPALATPAQNSGGLLKVLCGMGPVVTRTGGLSAWPRRPGLDGCCQLTMLTYRLWMDGVEFGAESAGFVSLAHAVAPSSQAVLFL